MLMIAGNRNVTLPRVDVVARWEGQLQRYDERAAQDACHTRMKVVPGKIRKHVPHGRPLGKYR